MSDDTFGAYWFVLKATGTPVDAVLAAVAQAGKREHSTEYWEMSDGETPSCVDDIQSAAAHVVDDLTTLETAKSLAEEGEERMAGKVVGLETEVEGLRLRHHVLSILERDPELHCAVAAATNLAAREANND